MKQSSMDQINKLIDKIKNSSRKKKTLLIAIDGRGGSGKTVISKKLKDKLEDCQIIQMDDFYLPSSRQGDGDDFNFDWKRLEAQVLIPLASDQPAKYQRYDWNKDNLAEGYDLPVGGIIIIEGCYSIRKELISYYDLTIWVEIDRDLGINRGIERDIRNEKPADIEQKIAQWKTNFQPLEDKYIKDNHPQKRADFVIDNN